jgi:O-antigen/teichoic acid export membrane protein
MFFSKIKITMRFDKKCFSMIFPYAWPQVPARIISSLSQNAVRFFIGAISFFALGIYSASFKIASISQIIYLSFNMAWGPFVFKKINDKDYHNFKEINFYILMIVSVFVILSMLLSGPVARVLLDPKYYEAVKFIPLYFTCNIIFIVKDSVDIGTKTTEKTKFISYIYAISFSIAFLAFSFLYYYDIEDLFIYGTVQFICGYLILIFTLVNSERLHFIGFSKQNYLIPLILYIACLFQYNFNLYL